MPNLFAQFLNNVSRGYGKVDRDIFRGVLPGGAASFASPIKQKAQSGATKAAKVVAGTAMNQLPDRANLFARYVTGVGNTNLQLDPSTLMDLRAAASKAPMAMGMIPNPLKVPEEFLVGMRQQLSSNPEGMNPNLRNMLSQTIFNAEKNKNLPDFVPGRVEAYGPGIVSSGPVIPYGRPDIGTSVTNTLGSYNVEVKPGTSVTFKDTYDMSNLSEDPDLVSGKFQPIKAIQELQSIFDPSKGYLGSTMGKTDASTRFAGKYGDMPNAQSKVASPATSLGRALLYALPIKPQPYDINVTMPY